MSKKFTYQVTEKVVFNQERDENEEFGYDITYEASYSELLYAIEDIIYYRYFSKFNTELSANFIDKVSSGIRSMLKDCDDIDSIADFFEEELHDYFKEEALDSVKGDWLCLISII